jgi:hypothetical protein
MHDLDLLVAEQLGLDEAAQAPFDPERALSDLYGE